MVMQSRLARPIFNISKRTAVLPASESAFSRPDIVDIETYVYPGNPSYAGMGPRAIPEEWVRDDKVVHYLIPKTFVDWLTPKFGETGIYSLLTMGTLALASKEYLVFHIETKIAIEFFVTWSLLNMLFGDSVREMAADQFTASYDRLYAVKEHDIEAYGEIVEQYKEAQMQAQGQALFNQQKLTNLALMLETEYLSRQNKLVSEITRKLNYQVAIEAALADQEARHMINWIETEVQAELAQLDQDEQIQVCVDQLKAL
jgi:hypothetical protein